MPNVTIDSVRSPKSTRAMLARLCANNAASTSNDIDSAICAVASVKRNRPRLLPPKVRVPFACNARDRVGADELRDRRHREHDGRDSRDRERRRYQHANRDRTSMTLEAAAAAARRSPHSTPNVMGKLNSAAAASEQQRLDGEQRIRACAAQRRATLAQRSRRSAQHRARTSDSRGSRKRSAESWRSPRRTPSAACAPDAGARRLAACPGHERERPWRGTTARSSIDRALRRCRGRLDVVDDRAKRRVQPLLAPASSETPGFNRPNTYKIAKNCRSSTIDGSDSSAF